MPRVISIFGTMRSLLLLIFSCCTLAVWAGPVLQGQIIAEQGKLPSKIRIASFLHQQNVDSIEVNSFGSFTYQLKETVPVLYRLQSEYSGYSFFVHPSEKTVRLNLIIKNGTISEAYVEDSQQDKAYKSFSKMLETFDMGMAQAIELGIFDSLHVKVFQNFNDVLSNFATTYKGTYTADSLLPLRRFALNKDGSMPTVKQYAQGFFNKVNFKDTTLLATPVYGNMVDFFAKGLNEALTETERTDALSNLMAKAKSSTVFYKYTADRIFTAAVNGEEEAMSIAFVSWVVTKGDAAKLSDIHAQAKMLLPTMPGKRFKEVIVGKDSLSAAVANNKYTLLMFWENTSPYCRIVLPEVKRTYDAFHTKGFEVFSIAVDTDTTTVNEYLAEQKANWPAVTITDGKNPAIKQYAIDELPVLVLVNQQGIIERRFSGIAAIDRYLRAALK